MSYWKRQEPLTAGDIFGAGMELGIIGITFSCDVLLGVLVLTVLYHFLPLLRR